MTVGRFVLKSAFKGDDAIRNVFTVSAGGGATPVISDAILYFNQCWTDAVLDIIHADWVSSSIALEIPDGSGHWGFVDEEPFELQGHSSDDMLPRAIAGVVIGVTASRRRGKKFIFGLVESTQDFGQLGTTSIAALDEFATGYTTPDTSAMTHPFEVGVVRPDGSDFIPFSGRRVDHLLGTQRRRKATVGM